MGGFSLDVKGAHKTSRVRERDRGLLGMRQQERLLFYRVQEDMCFSSSPPGTNITKGAKLLSARHINIQSKSDLQKVPVTTKRIWMRVADPSSSRRRLSVISPFATSAPGSGARAHCDRPHFL